MTRLALAFCVALLALCCSQQAAAQSLSNDTLPAVLEPDVALSDVGDVLGRPSIPGEQLGRMVIPQRVTLPFDRQIMILEASVRVNFLTTTNFTTIVNSLGDFSLDPTPAFSVQGISIIEQNTTVSGLGVITNCVLALDLTQQQLPGPVTNALLEAFILTYRVDMSETIEIDMYDVGAFETSMTLAPSPGTQAIPIETVDASLSDVRVITRNEFVRGEVVFPLGPTNMADVIGTLNLASGTTPSNFVGCLRAADMDGDFFVTITDGLYLLAYLFQSGPTPVTPFPSCGSAEVVDNVGCDASPACP